MKFTKKTFEQMADSVEPRFPGFEADYVAFTQWALKGVVRTLSRMDEAPTQEQWTQLRESLAGIITDIDTIEEAVS